MSYSDIVNLIITIITSLLSLLFVHFIFFGFVGLFKHKKYPKTDKKLKYGIIIPARNEEKVIGNLIESIKKNNYPQDKLQIFVIAHNCTDKTAEIARNYGATVYEYNNNNERTKGYAYKYLFDCLNKDYDTLAYDGFFMFDADNILDENYISTMNDAFVYENKQAIISSYRNSKNFGRTLISSLYGVFFLSACRFESRGRTRLGCSTRIQGTGFIINSDIVKKGWPYVTLTEDWEFTADQIIKGNKIKICYDAIFYDEQPTNLKVMFRQRLRWSKGHLLVCITRFNDLIKRLFSKKDKTKNTGSIYDMFTNILPISVSTFFITILQILLLTLTPIFEPDRVSEVWLHFATGMGTSILVGYCSFFIASILTFILERKHIKDVSLGLKIATCFVWPIFMLINVFIEVVALFKDVQWHSIPHTDESNFDTLNGKQNKCEVIQLQEDEKQKQSKISNKS